MSSIVSRRPSFRNQSKDSRWMSIRLGRSRTCLRREKDLRARGAVTVWAKEIQPPLEATENEGGAKNQVAGRAKWCYVGELPSIGQPTLQPQAGRGEGRWSTGRMVAGVPGGPGLRASGGRSGCSRSGRLA